VVFLIEHPLVASLSRDTDALRHHLFFFSVNDFFNLHLFLICCGFAVGAFVAGFPVLPSSTTTMPIVLPEAALGSLAVGVGFAHYCTRLLWLAVSLGPARSSIVRLLSLANRS
jgi:hypothetical protein